MLLSEQGRSLLLDAATLGSLALAHVSAHHCLLAVLIGGCHTGSVRGGALAMAATSVRGLAVLILGGNTLVAFQRAQPFLLALLRLLAVIVAVRNALALLGRALALSLAAAGVLALLPRPDGFRCLASAVFGTRQARRTVVRLTIPAWSGYGR